MLTCQKSKDANLTRRLVNESYWIMEIDKRSIVSMTLLVKYVELEIEEEQESATCPSADDAPEEVRDQSPEEPETQPPSPTTETQPSLSTAPPL